MKPKKAKPFFFKVVASELMDFATDPEGMGMTVLHLAKELQKGQSDIPFIQGLIDEANAYIQTKKDAGSAGGLARSNNAKAKGGTA